MTAGRVIVRLPLLEALEAYPECRALSYGDGGGMSVLFARCSDRTVKSIQAFIALDNGHPIGWAWAISTKVRGRQSFISFSFVERMQRGNGVGFSLYNSVRKFATSRHRSLFLDYQAQAIKTKNKINTWDSSVMSNLMTGITPGEWAERRAWQ